MGWGGEESGLFVWWEGREETELIDVDDDDEIVAPQDLPVELILQIDKPYRISPKG